MANKTLSIIWIAIIYYLLLSLMLMDLIGFYIDVPQNHSLSLFFSQCRLPLCLVSFWLLFKKQTPDFRRVLFLLGAAVIVSTVFDVVNCISQNVKYDKYLFDRIFLMLSGGLMVFLALDSRRYLDPNTIEENAE